MAPLSVELGPGMMGNIFDGIQRPLRKIYEGAGRRCVLLPACTALLAWTVLFLLSPFVPLGVSVGALDHEKLYEYTPVADLREGGLIAAGTVIGAANENALMSAHAVMVPPNISGEIVKIYGGGTDGHESFTLDDPLMDIRDSRTGLVRSVTMSHYWPVRKPRPVANKMPGNKALITGQRVLDVLFPCV
jgi:V-type H+-transporting ATPase subunit A